MKAISYLDPLSDQPVRIADQFISAETYLEVVQKLIIPCVDTVFTVKGEKALYLAKRLALPLQGIWLLGGRMFFNDRTPEESISRSVKSETGLEISPNRFTFVRTNLYSWVRVAQGDFPGRSIGLTYSCEVTAEEISQMAAGLAASEYDTKFGIQRFNCQRLASAGVHPALIDLFNQMFPG